MPKENEKDSTLGHVRVVKLTNSRNDAAPSEGHLAYLCKRHRKGEIYKATCFSHTITDPCLPDPLRNRISALFLTGLP